MLRKRHFRRPPPPPRVGEWRKDSRRWFRLSAIPIHVWFGLILPLVLAVGAWRLWPDAADYINEDEEYAEFLLRFHKLAQDQFRREDLDGNGVRDYWTADVFKPMSMVYGVSPPPQQPLFGYTFIPLEQDATTLPPERYRQDTDGTGKKTHHRSRFGVCAYPTPYDWRHTRTFIINEFGLVYAIDNGGRPITTWPPDEELVSRFEMLPAY